MDENYDDDYDDDAVMQPVAVDAAPTATAASAAQSSLLPGDMSATTAPTSAAAAAAAASASEPAAATVAANFVLPTVGIASMDTNKVTRKREPIAAKYLIDPTDANPRVRFSELFGPKQGDTTQRKKKKAKRRKNAGGSSANRFKEKVFTVSDDEDDFAFDLRSSSDEEAKKMYEFASSSSSSASSESEADHAPNGAADDDVSGRPRRNQGKPAAKRRKLASDSASGRGGAASAAGAVRTDVGVPLASDASQPLPEVPETMFAPVQLETWEDAIIWDDEDDGVGDGNAAAHRAADDVPPGDSDEDDAAFWAKEAAREKVDKGDVAAQKQTQPAMQQQQPSPRSLAAAGGGDDDDDDDDEDDLDDLDDAVAVSATSAADVLATAKPGARLDSTLEELTKNVRRRRQTEQVAPRSPSVRRLTQRNLELQGDDWLNLVVWDDQDVPPEMLRAADTVVIDMNDHELLLTEDMVIVPEHDEILDSDTLAARRKERLAKEKERQEAASKEAKAKMAAALEPTSHKPGVEDAEIGGIEGVDEEDLSDVEPVTEDKGPKDRFNLSNDQHYYPVVQRRKARAKRAKVTVKHSILATRLVTAKTSLSTLDRRNFHHPHLNLRRPLRLQVLPASEAVVDTRNIGGSSTRNGAGSGAGNGRGHVGSKAEAKFLEGGAGAAAALFAQAAREHGSTAGPFHRMADLTVREDRVVLLEYTEQHPPLLQLPGMCSRIFNYYKRKSRKGREALPMFQDGETVALMPEDESPIVGDVEAGTCVQTIYNNMYRAVIVRNRTRSTDFLLIRQETDKANRGKIFIREMPDIYNVGHEQPTIEVPAPHSRAANTFVRNRLSVWIYRYFKEKIQKERLHIKSVTAAFPSLSEAAVRKRLKECADFQRGGDDSGWWTRKPGYKLPPEDELRNQITPEMVCAYESMLAGQQRLLDRGITKVQNINVALDDPVVIGIKPNKDEDTDIKKKEDLTPEDEELLLAPWNLTANFVAAMNARGMLQISGLGDAQGKGEGYSFVRVPQRAPPTKKENKGEKPKPSVTGTDADLRKLSLVELREILRNFGVNEEIIMKTKRWQLVHMVRKHSSEAAATGDGGDMVRFARGSRYSHEVQQQMYRDTRQRILRHELEFLSRGADSSSDEESSDDEEDLADLTAAFDADLAGRRPASSSSKPVDPNEEEEKREIAQLHAMLAEERNRAAEAGTPMSGVTGPPTDPLGTPAPMTPGPDADDDEEPMRQPAEGKRFILKRTVFRKMPDGTHMPVRTSLVRDPKLVGAYMKKHKQKSGLDAKEEKQRLNMKREKRRLQEQLRRLKKNAEKQRILKARLISGDLDGVLETTVNSNTVCGACGMRGHMRTNRICPMFSETANQISEGRRTTVAPVAAGSSSSQTPSLKLRIGGQSDDLVLPRRKKRRPTVIPGLSDDDDDYIDAVGANEYRPPTKNRTRVRRSPEVELANLLERVHERIRDRRDISFPFLEKVNTKFAPDYYDIVKNPMDLTKVRTLIRQQKYRSRHDYLNDMQLIVSNCKLYNNESRNPHLIAMADGLLNLAHIELHKVSKDLDQCERELNPEWKVSSRKDEPEGEDGDVDIE